MSTKNKKTVKQAEVNELEFVAVRHVTTGLYLVATERRRINAYGPDQPTDITMTWNELDVASVMTRQTAVKVAAAYIALADDPDVEIEPVEEGVKA